MTLSDQAPRSKHTHSQRCASANGLSTTVSPSLFVLPCPRRWWFRFRLLGLDDLPRDTRYLWSGIKNWVNPNPLTVARVGSKRGNCNEEDPRITGGGFGERKGGSNVDASKGQSLVQRCRYLSTSCAHFLRQQCGRHRGFCWPHATTRVSARTWHYRYLAPSFLPIATPRRWIRHFRLHFGAFKLRVIGGFQGIPDGGSYSRNARHHRNGPESYVGPTPLV